MTANDEQRARTQVEAMEPSRSGRRMPADRASRTALNMSIAAVFVIGLTVWATNFFGTSVFLPGFAAWLILWTLGLGFAIAAMRNAFSSATPRDVKRRSWLAIGISAADMLLVFAFFLAIAMAIDRLE